MTNHIRHKINEIFGDEIDNNRNLIMKKHTESNKLIKRKLIDNKNYNYELISNLNKRKSNPDEYYKDNKKFLNENFDDDLSPKNKKRKIFINKNFKKENTEKENNYKSNQNIYFLEKRKSELTKDKKIKFLLEDKKLEVGKINEFKLSKKKTNPKKIIMIEKQKYPKKKMIFDRLKENNKELNNENNEENISIKKKHKKSGFIKPKKILIRAIKALDIKYRSNETIKAKNKPLKSNDINKEDQEEKFFDANEDSSNYIKNNMNSSDSSNSKTIKTNKSNKSYKNNYIQKNGKNASIKKSENEFFQSSNFSNDSDDNENGIKKDICIKKNSKCNEMIKHCRTFKKHNNSSYNKNIKKSSSYKRNNYNSLIQKKERTNRSKNNSLSSSCLSDSVEENKNSENNNHKEGNVLSIIPEKGNKKIYYEDINQNMDVIKPENLITLENNKNKDRNINKSISIEIQKNNIIINNNISNNITVHKKGSDAKKNELKKEEDTINKNTEQNKKVKPYKVKVRKKFPFCCL